MRTNLFNVFSGPNGLADFLNPESHPPTPLVELSSPLLNPYLDSKVRIFAKLAFLSPLLTIKWLPAFNMLAEAHERGGLEGVKTIVENSSGGTAFALSVIARVVFGIEKLRVYVPRDMAPAKLDGLRLMGMDIVFSSTDPEELSGTEKARIDGKEPDVFNPDQYANLANMRAHQKWLAPQIWAQTGGKLSLYAAAMGTTGTLIGPSHYFRDMSERVSILGVTPTVDQVPGARSLARIEKDVRFDWQSAINWRFDVDPQASYRSSHSLWRHGILGGPTSGLALSGICGFLDANRSKWDSMRNADGEIVAVFPCPDPAILYTEKYSTHLDSSDLS